MSKTPNIDALIPVLYLKGVSTNDFPDGRQAILGGNAAGLSPSTITRLKKVWQDEYEKWENGVSRAISGMCSG